MLFQLPFLVHGDGGSLTMDGVSQIGLRISNTLRAIVTHYRLVFFCLVIGLLRLIVFAFMCRFHFWDI